jgi:hypothetical protein
VSCASLDLPGAGRGVEPVLPQQLDRGAPHVVRRCLAGDAEELEEVHTLHGRQRAQEALADMALLVGRDLVLEVHDFLVVVPRAVGVRHHRGCRRSRVHHGNGRERTPVAPELHHLRRQERIEEPIRLQRRERA